MIRQAIQKLIGGDALTEREAALAMTDIMEGSATAAQIAAFLTALRMKGETVTEITGFARIMREKAVTVPTQRFPLVDTCGTGGDVIKTFNISTTAAFIAAAAGVPVAKHGNRAVTSVCGSADVLEVLGARLDLSAEAVGRCVDEVGIGFLFARSHHPAMKYAAPVRTELGFRTVFNILGPLTNPAGATRQVIGVYDGTLCRTLAEAMLNLGAEHVLVVHGMRGLDEISTWESTLIAEGRNGQVSTYMITPDSLGIIPALPEDVGAGCDRIEGAALVRGVLDATDRGPRRDIALANAAAALLVGGKVRTLREGVILARETVDSGAAFQKLEAFIACTQEMTA